ncbi:hypothetical protein LCGC14_0888540 [marine sediment metagenome]|uniref:Uncharacterized protein n=1 Tax=marine sediment metagenome TaxID=412755 RepID=A0A0F9RJ75_9ZZZZ
MQELVNTTSELSDTITDVLTLLKNTTEIVVKTVVEDLAYLTKQITTVVMYNVVGLLDDILNLYSYEWIVVNRRLQELDNTINSLIYNKVNSINNLIDGFDRINNLIIQRFADELEQIDLGINPYYQERMFTIYGRIAEFSVAIEAPPFYLEGVIENARFFGLSLACKSGLSYYDFQWNWDIGIDNLLNHITRFITLYRQNPQWIKVDVENLLVKPLYAIERNKYIDQKELLSSIINKIVQLSNSVGFNEVDIAENKQAIIDIFEFEIEPMLKELSDSFDNWKESIYANDTKLNATRHIIFNIGIQTAFAKIASVLGLLDYGGDLLLRINGLSDGLRLEQEDKIAEVTTRSFERLVPEWIAEIKKDRG